MTTILADAAAPDARYALTDPADQGLTFTLDPMHSPHALSPLHQSVHGKNCPVGFVTAAQEHKLPIAAWEHRYRNHFQFNRIVPVVPESEAHAAQIGRDVEESLQHQCRILGERWENEHLPRLKELLSRLEAISALPDDADIGPALVDELNDIYAEMWTIHFRIAGPMLVANQVFDEFYKDLFGPDADAYGLTGGRETLTVRNGIALSDLAHLARELGLDDVLLDLPADQVASRLEETEKGQVFLQRLDDFLATNGLRQDRSDLAAPTWREDPRSAIATIQRYVATGRDNRAEFAERVAKAEVMTADARAALADYPEPVRQQFEGMLASARMGAFLQEEHNDYIDQAGLAGTRLAFLRIGRALAAKGIIDAADDVFMLSSEEISAALEGSVPDLRAIVASNRESFERALQETPPMFVGAPPAGTPPPDNPMTRAMGSFFGAGPQISDDPNVIKGAAGSRGQLTAPAFIARTLEEATAIPPGHVLVTITTTPPWTPLFGIAGAIITETGGPLSHCAIMAREYGIPAVVGAHGATTAITTGQMVTVDGSGGLVQLQP